MGIIWEYFKITMWFVTLMIIIINLQLMWDYNIYMDYNFRDISGKTLGKKNGGLHSHGSTSPSTVMVIFHRLEMGFHGFKMVI